MSNVDIEIEARKILSEIAAEAKLSSVSGRAISSERKLISGRFGSSSAGHEDDWIADILGSNSGSKQRHYSEDSNSGGSGSERSDFDGRSSSSVSSGDDARSIHSDSVNEISDEKLNAMLYGSRLTVAKVSASKSPSPERKRVNITQDSFDLSEIEQKNKEIAKLQKLLEDRSDAFKDMIISDDYIQEVRAKPKSSQTFYEIACVSVYDNTKEFRRLLTTTNAALSETKASLHNMNERYELLNSEKNNMAKSHTSQLSMIDKENFELKERINSLELKVQFERTARQENEDKANKYDSAVTESKRQANDIQSLQSTLETLTRGDREIRSKLYDYEQKNSALVQDKIYLTNENRELKVKFDEATKQLDELKLRSHSFELKNVQLNDQIFEIQSKSKSEFEDKLQKELDRIREESLREIDNIKFASKELSERECRVLRDDKMAKDMECQALRKRIDQESQELVNLQRELSQHQTQSVTEISQLRAELKIKIFEYNSLGSKLEDQMSRYRQLELNFAELTDENNMRKASLLKFESDSNYRENSLRQKLEDCQSRLRMYESLENDVDDAVIRAAAKSGTDNDAFDTINAIHSYSGLSNNSQRRIQQSVQLAQKLLESKKNYDSLVEKNLSLQQDLDILKRDNKILRENSQLNSQPVNFLITKLREEEAKNIELNHLNEDLESQLTASKTDLAALQSERLNLMGKLKVLLSHRSEVKEIRRVIDRLRDDNGSDAEGEYGDDIFDDDIQANQGGAIDEISYDNAFEGNSNSNINNSASSAAGFGSHLLVDDLAINQSKRSGGY